MRLGNGDTLTNGKKACAAKGEHGNAAVLEKLNLVRDNKIMGMRRQVFSALLILFALAAFSVLSVQNAAAADAAATSSLMVKLVNGLTPEERNAVIARDGGTEVSSIPALRLHVVECQSGDLSAVLSNYRSDPQVESVEINNTRKVEGTPSDPFYSTQWSLSKIGWDTVFGSVVPIGVSTVAVLDTGIDSTHPELAGVVVPGTSVLDGSAGMSDPNGHGTWLAGIVAAATDNSIGVAGVGFANVSVMPVTVLGPDGTGRDSDIIAGIMYAADHGADVILMGFSNPGFSQNLQDAIDYAWSQNVVVVAATGNDGVSTATYPAGDRGVIGVSATDENDLLASFSNCGLDAFLGAPGTDILTTDLNSGYATVSGTSTSAAIVAGVAGFMRAVDPTLDNGVIVGRLAETADPAGTLDQTGNGRVDMARAVSDPGTDFIEPVGVPDGGGPIVGPYTAAALTLQSVAVGTQTGTLNSGTAGSATFSISLTKSSGSGSATLSVTSTLPSGVTASFNPNPVPITNAGTSTLTISTSSSTPAGITSFTVQAVASNTVTSSGTLTINGTDQTITVGTHAPGSAAYDSQFTVAATASSGLAVTYSSGSPSVCTNSGATFTMVAAGGTCVVQYDQAGDGTYNAAPQVTENVTATKADQSIGTISFSPPSLSAGGTTTASATATSGLAVSFSSTTPGVCTVVGSTVTGVSSGTCTIAADQGGDTNYNAAPQVTQNLSVGPGAVDHIVISPSSASITAGGSQSYTSEAFDASSNSLGDVTASTIFTINPNGSCTGATCTATTAGVHTVTGTYSGKSATASLTVTAGALDHMVISPSSASITAGGSQSYTSEAFDASGNSLGDVTGFTTFTVNPEGSCTGASCTATWVGAHTVTGTYSGKSATASLTVIESGVDLLPTASGTLSFNTTTWTVTFIDSSTSDSAPLSNVTIAWGDGLTTTQAPGTTFVHTYVEAGDYIITQTVRDTAGERVYTTYAVAAINPVITGNVYKHASTTGISGAYVFVTRVAGGRTYTYYAVTNSAGHYQFSILYAGTYSNLRVTKAGYTFPTINPPATDGSDNNFTAN
jgi:hypothetical protein